MALTAVTKQIRDGLNVAFAAIWAKELSPPSAALDADTVVSTFTIYGHIYSTTKALTNAAVSFASSGENTVIAGTGSQTIRVFRGYLSAASPVTMTIKNAASGTTLATIPLTTYGVFDFDSYASEPLFVTASSGAFVISLSSAVQVYGFVQYTKS